MIEEETSPVITLPDDIDTKEIKLCNAFDEGCESCQ